jgi:hypothetical protein
MGKKKYYNETPVPGDLESEIIETTEHLTKEETVKEVEAIVDGVQMALNIRKDPEIKSNNQIAILGKGTKIIVVDPDKTVKNKDGEWFKIRLFNKDKDEPDANGYAMKKYIKII